MRVPLLLLLLLGIAAAGRRGGGCTSTSGSFTLSDDSGDRAGGGEELRQELSELDDSLEFQLGESVSTGAFKRGARPVRGNTAGGTDADAPTGEQSDGTMKDGSSEPQGREADNRQAQDAPSSCEIFQGETNCLSQFNTLGCTWDQSQLRCTSMNGGNIAATTNQKTGTMQPSSSSAEAATMQSARTNSSDRLVYNKAKCRGTPGDEKLIRKGAGVVGALDCGAGQTGALMNKEEREKRVVDPGIFCPDNLSRGRYFQFTSDGQEVCFSFKMRGVYKAVTAVGGQLCKQDDCSDSISRGIRVNTTRMKEAKGVVIKAQVAHPNDASKPVAAFALKRIAPCTKDSDGTQQCDHVFKTGFCVDCQNAPNPKSGPWFADVKMALSTEEELDNVVDNCLPAAFNSTPAEYWDVDFKPTEPLVQLDSFRCSQQDHDIFLDYLKAF